MRANIDRRQSVPLPRQQAQNPHRRRNPEDFYGIDTATDESWSPDDPLSELEDGPNAGQIVGAIFDPAGLFGGGIGGLFKPQAGPPDAMAALNAKIQENMARVQQAALAAGKPEAAASAAGAAQVAQQATQNAIAEAKSGGGLLPMLAQGIGQSFGVPAATPTASLLGAGMGGTAYGTGYLPQPYGNLAQLTTGGGQFLPPIQSGYADAQRQGMMAEFDALRHHVEQVGRDLMGNLTGASTPVLNDIRDMLSTGQTQIGATAEHRQYMNQHQFRAMVRNYLRAIMQRLRLPLNAAYYDPSLVNSVYTTQPGGTVAASNAPIFKRY
jgi:hypothetical protein